jgi:hypothetical protein
MYESSIRQVLGTEAGREFLAYILRKLKYCDVIQTENDMAVRNAGVQILEDLIDLAGIRVDVLRIK